MLLLEYCHEFATKDDKTEERHNPFKKPIELVQNAIGVETKKEEKKELKIAFEHISEKLEKSLNDGFWERYFGILTDDKHSSDLSIETAFKLAFDDKITVL